MISSLPANLPALREYEPMDRHTSWRAGGVARFYSEPASLEEVRSLLEWATAAALPLVWIGRGTNMLVDDAGFPGLIASYRAQAWQVEEHDDRVLVRVEGGAVMAGMARRLAAMGLAGLEWAEGLPGTVGGAVVGNAGCYGGDTATMLQSVELFVDGTIERWLPSQLAYSYRHSLLKGDRAFDRPSPLVVAATFQLRRADPFMLMERMAAIAAERKRKTPTGSSCGSVFKNPPGDSAGRLIEAAGLKGRSIGAAQISSMHANYIMNRGGATATEIQALIALARTTVWERFGVALELEVRILA